MEALEGQAEFSRRFARTSLLIQQGMEQGLHIGAQLYVSQDRKPLADFATGESRPGTSMKTDTVMLWLSSTKPLAAVSIMQLVERGLLKLHDTVADYIPEFASGGKEPIQIFHLLTHTGGFRAAMLGEPETDWDEVVRRACAAKLEPSWMPGEKAGYHVATSWYILGELVRRIDGRHFRDYVREEIFLPLSMHDCWVGMPMEQFRAYGERLGQVQRTERPGQGPYHWSTEMGATRCAPGANGHGPMRELGRFYEAMLSGGSLDRNRILNPESVQQMTTRQRKEMYDETFKHVMDWGLGFIINSAQYGADTVPYGYGAHASDASFGHSGSQSSVGFADPEHRLVVALVFNGMPGERAHQQRIRPVLSAIYEDVGLA